MNITVAITGTADVISKLRRLEAGLTNFQEPLNAIGKELVSYYENQVFGSQGGIIGVTWPTLAASTIQYKIRHSDKMQAGSSPSMPLVYTGAMQKSFRAVADNTKLEVDNTAPYFKYHQSTEQRSKIPRRPMIGINDEIQSIVKKILQADIQQKIEA